MRKNPTNAPIDVGRKFSKARLLAQRVGISPRTLFRWADAGLIARHKVNGRVVLFDEAEVFALLDEARIQATVNAS